MESLPFTPMKHLIFLENKILELKNDIGQENLSNIKNFYIERRKTKEYIEDIHQIMSEKLNISVETSKKATELYNFKKDYKSRIKLRILHNTIIKFAEIFEGFPIYFINSLDYRLRMYPWNYMFNRTSGIYKYLMMESKSKIKRKEINLMIQNYFKNDPENIKKFYEVKDSLDDIQIIKWFKELNIKTNFNNDSFFYYYLLKKEIEDLDSNNFRSGFLLEIDQKASSSVLLSIILGDYILAQQTNLISKNETKDANSYIMEKSVEWFKGKISEESYKIISEERKLHKYLFMCSIYNQTMYGRMKRVKEYIKNGTDMLTISTEYPEFINSVFPSISDKKSKFNKIVLYYLVNSDKPIEIETLDGSVVTWHIFNKSLNINNKIKVKNPVTKLYEGLHLNILDPRGTNNRKTIAGMLPSFIHSVDGSIMRLLILDIYKKNNYIINHLHDSIQFHPSKYDQVLESITEVYTSKEVKDVLMKRFIERLRKNLLEEKIYEFDKLVDDLYDDKFIKIDINKVDFNVTAMFPFE
jgi:DNA-directed RNA polymerase